MQPSVIRPVVIYPFVQPRNLDALSALYKFLATLTPDERFGRPQTIINRGLDIT